MQQPRARLSHLATALIFGFLALAATRGAESKFPHTVHIAVRSDGHPGRGTEDDPFDGSTQAKFDAVMRAQGAGSDIVLGPGVFLTKGNDDGHATDGFFLQPNTRLRGSGKGVTIVKLAALNSAECIHVAICTGAYGLKGTGRLVDFDHVTVEDLTVDCNAAGLELAAPNNNNNVATYGVQLSGNSATIRNVEVTGAYAMSGPFESFAIGIFAMTRDIDGALIENCAVRASVGNYVTSIILGGNVGLTASGVVSHNLVVDTDWIAYSGGCTTRSVFASNVADRVGYGFRFDTGAFSDVIFTGNIWNARKSAILLTPQVPAAPVGDILISGNTLRAREGPVISLSSLNSTRVKGIAMQGNILRSDTKNAKAISLDAAAAGFYSDIHVMENQTDLSFDFPAHASVKMASPLPISPSPASGDGK
jgi:hypothetical protein